MANNLSSENSSNDRISKLPEPVLRHILSFLSTKLAATTSVLSKPWRYLWTSVCDLDIIVAEDKSFDYIISKIFLSRRTWCVRKLRLSFSCMSDSDPIIIRSFLCSAVEERNVEELDFYTFELFKFPTSLLCSKTLVVLKLRGEIMIDIIGSSVHLPSLKVLHLERVKYKDEDTFHILISGCPVLDYLAVDFLLHTDFHYEISSLSVKHIIILRHVTHNPRLPSKITVIAPALEHFTIDVAPTALVLDNVPSLVHAKFNFYLLGVPLRDKYWDTMKVTFGALCNVQFLELNFHYSEVLFHYIIPIATFPRFDNLVELKIISDCCSLPLLLHMLLNCSRLQHITLVSKMWDSCTMSQYCWISPQQVPNCLVFHLTTAKLEGFQGLEAEIGFTQYVLNNSNVLRSMTIRYRDHTNLERKFSAFHKISESLKQATRCQLTFQPQF